jgi:hypothetical protein
MGFPLEIKPGTPLAVVPEEPVEIPKEAPVEEKSSISPVIPLPEKPEVKPEPLPIIEAPKEEVPPEEPIAPAVEEPAKEIPKEEPAAEELVVDRVSEEVVEPESELQEPSESEKQELPQETTEPPVEETLAEKPLEQPSEEPSELPAVEEVILSPVDKSVEKPATKPSFDAYAEVLTEQPCTGAILLKAAECLLGGSQHVTALIKNRLTRRGEDILSLTESLIYLPLFEKGIVNKEIEDLWALIDRKIPLDSILLYLNELQVVNTLLPKISETVSKACQDVRCLKAILSDGNAFY